MTCDYKLYAYKIEKWFMLLDIISVMTLTFDVYVRINFKMPSVHKMIKHTLKILQQDYHVFRHILDTKDYRVNINRGVLRTQLNI